MTKITRARFLELSGVLAGAVGFGRSLEAEAQTASSHSITEPDLVVLNARVYTIDDTNPRAEAFAIKDGKFIAVGRTSDITNLVGQRTQVIDADQRTVTPGFIDAHCHPSGINELYEVNANVRTVKELQEALFKKVTGTPPGYWVQAFMLRAAVDFILHNY
jgi:predicted amidohydrolase YtcJ